MNLKNLFGLRTIVEGIVREVVEKMTKDAELRVEMTRDGGKVSYVKKLG